MKKLILLIAVAAVAGMVSGCASYSKVIAAFAKDNAAASLDVTTLYGQIHYKRCMPIGTNNVTITAEGGISTK